VQHECCIFTRYADTDAQEERKQERKVLVTFIPTKRARGLQGSLWHFIVSSKYDHQASLVINFSRKEISALNKMTTVVKKSAHIPYMTTLRLGIESRELLRTCGRGGGGSILGESVANVGRGGSIVKRLKFACAQLWQQKLRRKIKGNR
jgi:hypothetical protein